MQIYYEKAVSGITISSLAVLKVYSSCIEGRGLRTADFRKTKTVFTIFQTLGWSHLCRSPS